MWYNKRKQVFYLCRFDRDCIWEAKILARATRKFSVSGMYHVLLRSEGKIFNSKNDYIKFVQIVNECFSECGGLMGYSFFDNRVHFVIMDKEKKISTIMRIITTKYSRYKKESVFYDRFKAEPVENDNELSQVLDFICLNPSHTDLKDWFCSRNSANEYRCAIDEQELAEHTISENTMPLRMFMDDYKNMSETELGFFVKLISGVDMCDIKALPPEKRSECIKKLQSDRWISNRKLSAMLGITRSNITYNLTDREKNSTETDMTENINNSENLDIESDIEDKEDKPKLDVWLL